MVENYTIILDIFMNVESDDGVNYTYYILISAPASYSLICFAAAALGLDQRSVSAAAAAAAVREMGNDSVCPGSRLTS